MPKAGRWLYCLWYHRSPGQAGFSKALWFIAVSLPGFLLSGCISDIDLDQPSTLGQYVIEGQIETDQFAKVLVSKTQPYFSTFGNTDLLDLIETKASVVLSDGFSTEQLSLVMDTFYTEIPVYRTYNMKGITGRVYTLSVTIDSTTYTAIDTLLPPIYPDSLWFTEDSTHEDLGLINYKLTDPVEPGNYYHLLYKRLDKDDDYLPLAIGILNDGFGNGKTWQIVLIRSGTNVLAPSDPWFRKGETVVIKTQNMNPKAGKVWEAVEHEAFYTLNPLNSHQALPTNITNGALGLWGVYGISLDTIKIW